MGKSIPEKIQEVLESADEALSIRDISEVLPWDDYDSIKAAIARMAERGEVVRESRGHYRALKPGEVVPRFPTASPRYDEMVSYPVLDFGVGAGPASVQEPTGEYIMAPMSIVRGWTGGKVPKDNEAYWTTVRGTSMEPWLPDGSPILVAGCEEVVQGGRYVIYLDDSDAEVVKRIERIGDGIFRVISDNPGHSNQTLRHIEDDVYEDQEYHVKIRLRVRGVVLYPKDTGYAITKMITDRR